MSAAYTHDVTVKVGEYTLDDGQKRFRTRRIGRVYKTEEGRLFMRVDAEQLNPITASLARAKGEDSVILNLWPVEAKDKTAAPAADDPDDDISTF